MKGGVLLMKCPSCNIGELSTNRVDYSIGGSLIKNVPALSCSCGEVVLAEGVLSKIMDYLKQPGHNTVEDWRTLE